MRLTTIALMGALGGACAPTPCPEAPASTPAPAATIEPSPPTPLPLPAMEPARPRRVSAGAPPLAAWLPVDCEGRVYLDVERLMAGHEELLEQIAAGIIAVEDREGRVASAMKVLRQGGLDPFRSIRAVAGCTRPDVGVVELAGAPPKPLDTLRRAVMALDEGSPSITTSPRPTLDLRSDDGVVEVEPGLLAFTDHLSRIEPMLQEKAGSEGFREVGDLLVFVQLEEVTFTVRDDGGRWLLHVEVWERASRRREERAQAERLLRQIADHLQQRTPLRRLGEALAGAKVGVHPRGFEVDFTLPRAHVADTLRAAQKLSPGELEDLLEGRAFR